MRVHHLTIVAVHFLALVTVTSTAAILPDEDMAGMEASTGAWGELRRGDHSRHRHHNNPQDGESGCPGCRQWQDLTERDSEKELIQLRIEKVKQDILSRLGLSSAPNVSTNRVPENIPDPLLYYDSKDETTPENYVQGASGDGPEKITGEEIIHSKQIIVFGEEVQFLHKKSPDLKHTFYFNVPTGVPVDDVISVELWFYREDDPQLNNCTNVTQTITVHSLANDASQHQQHQQHSDISRMKVLASQELQHHSGWFHMDLREAVQSWMTNPKSNRGVGVEHGDCVSLKTGLSHRPFLAIGTRRRNPRRRKRDAPQCEDGTQNCCKKHSLYINFRELGWNFIISPQGYDANYCHGPCAVPSVDNILVARRAHSALLQKFSRIRNNPDVLPCCAATSFSSLSLLYMDDKGLVIREDIENMRVELCGCS